MYLGSATLASSTEEELTTAGLEVGDTTTEAGLEDGDTILEGGEADCVDCSVATSPTVELSDPSNTPSKQEESLGSSELKVVICSFASSEMYPQQPSDVLCKVHVIHVGIVQAGCVREVVLERRVEWEEEEQCEHRAGEQQCYTSPATRYTSVQVEECGERYVKVGCSLVDEDLKCLIFCHAGLLDRHGAEGGEGECEGVSARAGEGVRGGGRGGVQPGGGRALSDRAHQRVCDAPAGGRGGGGGQGRVQHSHRGEVRGWGLCPGSSAGAQLDSCALCFTVPARCVGLYPPPPPATPPPPGAAGWLSRCAGWTAGWWRWGSSAGTPSEPSHQR